MGTGLSPALARIFLDRLATWRLLAFTVAGFAFSLAVILGTIGLMDGFEETLKAGLRRASGDAALSSRRGFFTLDPVTEEILRRGGVTSVAPLVQAEAFALSEGRSRAVLVRGVETDSFSASTGLALSFGADEVAVGKGLAREWGLTPGSALTLVLARGQEGALPTLLPLRVGQVVSHGIHEKDQRLLYAPKRLLDERLELHGRSNLVLLSFGQTLPRDFETRLRRLGRELDAPWALRPAWQDFSGILEAVAVEKASIAVVLQLIVLVAVFNVAAFLITLRTRKAQEYFLLRAIGLPRWRFFRFGSLLLAVVWILSCLGAWALVGVFNLLLAHAPWLQVPGDIYMLTRLQVVLDAADYAWVFVPALGWIALLGWGTARRLRRQSLLTGLRQEFA